MDEQCGLPRRSRKNLTVAPFAHRVQRIGKLPQQIGGRKRQTQAGLAGVRVGLYVDDRLAIVGMGGELGEPAAGRLQKWQ